MTPGDFIVKKRRIWQAGAVRLSREKSCTQYARQVVPRLVDGVQIRFPETEISVGLDVTVRSGRLEGRLLLEMLYDQAVSSIALDMGLAALKAFHQADTSSLPRFMFSRAYDALRGGRIVLGEMLDPSGLTSNQRRELLRLVKHYTRKTEGDPVLLHGDLHPSNVIVDLEANSLGFIDLEAMRIGKAATNFAPLWGACHFADPVLGQRFFQMYAEHFPSVLDEHFYTDVKAELALRSCLHIKEAVRSPNLQLENQARRLLAIVLSGASFDEICYGGASIGN